MPAPRDVISEACKIRSIPSGSGDEAKCRNRSVCACSSVTTHLANVEADESIGQESQAKVS